MNTKSSNPFNGSYDFGLSIVKAGYVSIFIDSSTFNFSVAFLLATLNGSAASYNDWIRSLSPFIAVGLILKLSNVNGLPLGFPDSSFKSLSSFESTNDVSGNSHLNPSIYTKYPAIPNLSYVSANSLYPILNQIGIGGEPPELKHLRRSSFWVQAPSVSVRASSSTTPPSTPL